MEGDIKVDDRVSDRVKNKLKSLIEEEQGVGPEEDEEEEIRDEFQCCVCLDLLYKPVVLGCGHISCFWCVYNAMSHWQASRCPVCRHPYNHFPSICQLLHFLLLKLYPVAYKRREKEVREEENKNGYFSPQFDQQLSESKPLEKSNISQENQCYDSCQRLHCKEEERSLADNSSVSSLCDRDGAHIQPSTASTSCEASRNASSQIQQYNRGNIEYGGQKQITVTDLLCASCKKLLFRPVVLNCGHVYCESCIIVPENETWRCKQCGSFHPNGFPSVCLILHYFFEEQFPDKYQERQEACQNQSTCSSQAKRPGTEPSLLLTDLRSLWQSGNERNIHFFVGCDCCGMTPIIGKRYKCMDCTEKIGFDLCEECFKYPAKLPGRFNQQHKPHHRFDIVEPTSMPDLFFSLNPEHAVEVASPLAFRDDVPRDPHDSSNETDDASILTVRLSLNPEEDDSDGSTS